LLVEVISEFLFLVVLIADTEFEFALLGAEHDGLTVHAANHVERRLGFTTQGQFQKVFLDAGRESLAQLRLDLEEAVGRAHTLDALVRPLEVVMFNPKLDALTGRLEGVELGAHQEVLPDGGPEAFDLAEGHGMLRPGLEVGHMILLELGLEAAGAAPGGVLAAVIGEHLLGRLILADGHPIDLDDRGGGGTAEQIGPDHETRIIIEEGDEVGITAAQPKGEDVRLPHLVGRGPLEEARAGDVAGLARRNRSHQTSRVQVLAHRLRASRHEEPAAQELGDALDTEGGMLGFEFPDLVGDGRRKLGLTFVLCSRLQAHLAGQTVLVHPALDAGFADV
jgi:hypothetical protein